MKTSLLPFSKVFFYLAVTWLQVIETDERQNKRRRGNNSYLCVIIMTFNILFPFNFYFTIFHVTCNFTFHSVGVVTRAPPGTASPPSPLTTAKTGLWATTIPGSIILIRFYYSREGIRSLDLLLYQDSTLQRYYFPPTGIRYLDLLL